MLACNQPSKLPCEVGNSNFLNQALCLPVLPVLPSLLRQSVCTASRRRAQRITEEERVSSSFWVFKAQPSGRSRQDSAPRPQTEENYTEKQLRASHAGGARGEARVERYSGPQGRGTLCPVLHLSRILAPPSPQLYGIWEHQGSLPPYPGRVL